MRKAALLIMGILLLSALSVGGVSAYPPQPLFDMTVHITVSESGSAVFKINVRLVDEEERAELESIARTNSTEEANKAFENLLYNMIYRQLKDEVTERYPDARIVIPAEGLVKIGDNWTATVTFKWYNYLVEDGKKLQTAFYGPLRFTYRNVVYSYTWSRLYLTLPRSAYILNLAPVPKEFENNVAYWENGDFLPIIVITYDASLYEELQQNKTANENQTSGNFVTWGEFLNSTRKVITLQYDWSGFMKFNATFEGAPVNEYIEKRLVEEFEKNMGATGLSVNRGENSIEVRGEIKPQVDYHESLFTKEWNVTVTFPFRFDSVEIAGEHRESRTNGYSVNVLYTEEKNTKKLIVAGLVVAGLVAGALLLTRREEKPRRRERAPRTNRGSGLPKKE